VALAREGLVWDAVNLLVGAPALLVAHELARRGSLRGRLALAGLSLYFLYVYLQYAVMTALNPLFLVYVAIFALSGVVLAGTLATLDVEEVKARLSTLPRRAFATYAFLVALVLVLLWGRLVWRVLREGVFPIELAGMTTLPTQAIDLGIVVPLAVAAGALLLRERAWGYVLTALLIVFSFMMSFALPAWILAPHLREASIEILVAAPLLALCAGGTWLCVSFFRRIAPTVATA